MIEKNPPFSQSLFGLIENFNNNNALDIKPIMEIFLKYNPSFKSKKRSNYKDNNAHEFFN